MMYIKNILKNKYKFFYSDIFYEFDAGETRELDDDLAQAFFDTYPDVFMINEDPNKVSADFTVVKENAELITENADLTATNSKLAKENASLQRKIAKLEKQAKEHESKATDQSEDKSQSQ